MPEERNESQNVAPEAEAASVPSESDENASIDLWGGYDITLAEVPEISVAEPTRAIWIIGLRDSGKTTLIASIYEQFQLGPFGGMEFAGSRTLLGLERLCHQARPESDLLEPDTERTSASAGIRFMHIRVRDREHRSGILSLLLSDVSGELFRRIRDSAEEAEVFRGIRAPSHVAALVDGAKIIDPVTRHAAFNDAVTVLERFLEQNLIPTHTPIDVLITKDDLIRSSAQAVALGEFLEQKREYLNTVFTGGRRVVLHRVAARPKSGGYRAAEGIVDRFRAWTDAKTLDSTEVWAEPRLQRGAFGERLPWRLL